MPISNVLPADANLLGGGAAFDIVLRFMRNSNRVLFAIGIIFAVGAYLAGSSRVAAFVRGKTTGAIDAVGDRATTAASTSAWCRRSSPATSNGLRVLGVLVAFVILVHPTTRPR